MQLHCPLEIFAHHVLKRTDLDDAGIVNQDVDRAVTVDCFLNGGLDLRAIEQIARDRQYFAAATREIGFGAR